MEITEKEVITDVHVSQHGIPGSFKLRGERYIVTEILTGGPHRVRYTAHVEGISGVVMFTWRFGKWHIGPDTSG